MFCIDRLKKRAIIDDVMIEGASDDPLTMTTLNNRRQLQRKKMKINTQRLQWLHINATELANLVFEWADGYACEDEVEKAWELMDDMLDELQDVAPRPIEGERTK